MNIAVVAKMLTLHCLLPGLVLLPVTEFFHWMDGES
jgi:hypothetical protein